MEEVLGSDGEGSGAELGTGVGEGEGGMGEVSVDLVPLALWIVESVRCSFSSHLAFLEASMGKEITKEDADKRFRKYLHRSGLSSASSRFRVQWKPELRAAGRVVSSPVRKGPRNSPSRKFTLQIRDPVSAVEGGGGDVGGGSEDVGGGDGEGVGEGVEGEEGGGEATWRDIVARPWFPGFSPGLDGCVWGETGGKEGCGCVGVSTVLREHGWESFADHELGTHAIRSLNDSGQPWSGEDRRAWGLSYSSRRNRRALATEEGLASLNTAAATKLPILFFPALLYLASALKHPAANRPVGAVAQMLQRWLPDHATALRFASRASPKTQSYLEGALRIARALKRGQECLEKQKKTKQKKGKGGGKGKGGRVRDSLPPLSPSIPSFIGGVVEMEEDGGEVGVVDGRVLFLGRIAVEELTPALLMKAKVNHIILPAFARDPQAFAQRILHVAKLNRLLDPMHEILHPTPPKPLSITPPKPTTKATRKKVAIPTKTSKKKPPKKGEKGGKEKEKEDEKRKDGEKEKEERKEEGDEKGDEGSEKEEDGEEEKKEDEVTDVVEEGKESEDEEVKVLVGVVEVEKMEDKVKEVEEKEEEEERKSEGSEVESEIVVVEKKEVKKVTKKVMKKETLISPPPLSPPRATTRTRWSLGRVSATSSASSSTPTLRSPPSLRRIRPSYPVATTTITFSQPFPSQSKTKRPVSKLPPIYACKK